MKKIIFHGRSVLVTLIVMLLTVALGGYAQTAKIDFNLAAGDQSKIGSDSVWAVNNLVKFEVRISGAVTSIAHQFNLSFDSTYFFAVTSGPAALSTGPENGAVEANILWNNGGSLAFTTKTVIQTGTKSQLLVASTLDGASQNQAMSVSGEGLMAVVVLRVKAAFAYAGVPIAAAITLDSIKLVPYTNPGGGQWVVVGTTNTVNSLPVELTSFNAYMQGANSAILRWNTATEVNNHGFDIERRTEGSLNWMKIGFVTGAGTSNTPRDYTYQDVKLASGVYSYRLKQIDNDGRFNYSGIAQVDVGVAGKKLELLSNYPNPFNPVTEIRFSVPEDGFATLTVFNMLGQEVATLFSGTAKAGHYMLVTFNAGNMASGVYFSRLEYNGKSVIQRMLLTK